MSDLISRQDAIDAIIRYLMSPQAQLASTRSFKQCAIDILWDVPSAERKKGEWIERGIYLPECSECGGKACGLHAFDAVKSDYCPHCGARMVRGEEE